MAKKKPTAGKTGDAKKAAARKKLSPKRKAAGAGRDGAAPTGNGGCHVVTPAFTDLVTRLRDAFLDSVPEDARRKQARYVPIPRSPGQVEQEIDGEEED